MKKLNEKKLEKIREFMELADKHNVKINVELSVYGNPSMDIIKEAKELFKGRLRKEYQITSPNKWIIFHNASRGKDYIDSDLKLNIFYPRGGK